MSQLLIATNNQGKLIEIQALLQDLPVELASPGQLGLALEVEESGQTYAQNAALKGLAFARASGLLTLADDSGLEVQALDGLPGLRFRRALLQSRAPAMRTAAHISWSNCKGGRAPGRRVFRCVIALATAAGETRFAEGICPGEIPEERGQNGFGYDPLFLIPELGRTMAELSIQEKNCRATALGAVRAARAILVEMLAQA